MYPQVQDLPEDEREAIIQGHEKRVQADLIRLGLLPDKASHLTAQKARPQVLTLSRRLNESVVITVNGIDIEVVLVRVKTARAVQLGFIAPPSVSIVRRELITRGKNGQKPNARARKES